MKLIDMTITYKNGMKGMSKWHPVVKMERMAKLEEIGMNTSSLLLGSHIGTHMDAASHFIEGGYTIDQTPLENCIGEVTVVDLTFMEQGDAVKIENLKEYDLKPRIYLKFGWDRFIGQDKYNENFPYLTEEAAEYMLEKGVKLIAMDTLNLEKTPALEGKKFIIHKTLLAANVILVEALVNSEKIDCSKTYDLIALPLKLDGLDASPCRVVMIER